MRDSKRPDASADGQAAGKQRSHHRTSKPPERAHLGLRIRLRGLVHMTPHPLEAQIKPSLILMPKREKSMRQGLATGM
jgi:hypothetical protein